MSLPRHALVGLTALLLAGCMPSGSPSGPVLDARAAPSTALPPPPSTPAATAARPAPPELPRHLPGVGPKLAASIPPAARQALVVTGDGPASSPGHAVLYRNDGDGWLTGPTGLRGHERGPDARTAADPLDPALHPVVVMGDREALGR